MALDMKTAHTKAPDAPSDPAAPPHPSEQDTLLLELTMYSNYTWQRKTYKKGSVYRFLRAEAMKLLQETDHDRPIWKIYRKPVKKAAERGPVDSTSVRVESLPEDLDDGTTPERPKRIDVGSDEDIADIIKATAADDEDPTTDPGDITI